jgi:hypothetical protein
MSWCGDNRLTFSDGRTVLPRDIPTDLFGDIEQDYAKFQQGLDDEAREHEEDQDDDE